MQAMSVSTHSRISHIIVTDLDVYVEAEIKAIRIGVVMLVHRSVCLPGGEGEAGAARDRGLKSQPI